MAEREITTGVFYEEISDKASGKTLRRYRLVPGASTGYHIEKSKHRITPCCHGRLRRKDQQGNVIDEFDIEPGKTYDRDAGTAHDVENAGDNDMVLLKEEF